jgi:hypothetical protein
MGDKAQPLGAGGASGFVSEQALNTRSEKSLAISVIAVTEPSREALCVDDSQKRDLKDTGVYRKCKS